MKRKGHIRLFITGWLTLSVSFLYSQDFKQYLAPTRWGADDIIELLSDFDNSENDSVINAYYDKVIALKSSWLNGLNATSTININSKKIGVDDELFSYKQRVSVGLQWDLLKDGQKVSNLKAYEEDLNRQITLRNNERLNLLIRMEEKRMHIEQAYMDELAYWKNLEYHINSVISEWYRRAYFQDIVTRLEFDIAQERYQLALPIEGVVDTFSLDSIVPILPQYYIKKDFLLELDSIAFRESEILRVSQELADKKASKLNEITFSPNVRLNAIDENGRGFSSTYVSYGASLKVPFAVIKGKTNHLERDMLEMEYQTARNTKDQEIITQYHQVFRYLEEISFNQHEINKLEIENAGKLGDYFNVRREYYDRVLKIIHFKKKIALQKRNAFYTLTNIIEKSESALVFDYIVFF